MIDDSPDEFSDEPPLDRFDPAEASAILERTPAALSAMLAGLPDSLARATEGPGTWSPFDVVGHLIHGECTDWIPRARHILARETGPFESFDRTAQFTVSASRTLADLLAEFTVRRRENLGTLAAMGLTEEDLALPGLHPELGAVTLGQLLATWVVHDLDHIAQVARTIAKHYAANVGPWDAYLSILRDKR